MTFFLYRFSNATREGVNTSFVGCVIRYAKGRHFGLRGLIATVGRIVGYVSSQGAYACIYFRRVLRAPLTNGHFRFAVIFVDKEDHGLVNYCRESVILRRVFMGQYSIDTNHAICGCEVGSVRSSGLITSNLRTTILTLFRRFFARINRIRAFATRRYLNYVGSTCCVRFRSIFRRRLLLLTAGLFCRAAPCHASAASGRIRCLVFKRRREIISCIR